MRIGPAIASKSYLDPNIVLQVAVSLGCDALHPGYGFLLERADFAAACVAEKIRFVGPSPAAIAMMGDKSEARRTATQLGVPVVPGSEELSRTRRSLLAKRSQSATDPPESTGRRRRTRHVRGTGC